MLAYTEQGKNYGTNQAVEVFADGTFKLTKNLNFTLGIRINQLKNTGYQLLIATNLGQTMYNQPQNNQQFFQPEPTQNLIRVNGINGAKAYQMPANSTVALFDSNNDIMYVKSTDGAGFPSIRTFSFAELKEDMSTTENTDYISRQEFEEFKKELMNNGKEHGA